jgi:predicted nucleic acid-binding protein
MIVVDSSVWIDYFNGAANPQTEKLDALLGEEPLAIGDIILTEVLQGFRADRDFNTAKAMLLNLTIFDMLGQRNAIASAENFRVLRKTGVTIRKTVDCIIATSCIENNYSLLFSDRDFLPFVEFLGLMPVE